MLTEAEKGFLISVLKDPGREYPPEVEGMVKEILKGRVDIASADFAQLVDGLLKCEDDRSGNYKIGGVI